MLAQGDKSQDSPCVSCGLPTICRYRPESKYEVEEPLCVACYEWANRLEMRALPPVYFPIDSGYRLRFGYDLS